VRTIPQRKKFLVFPYGEEITQAKTIIDKVSGTFVPGEFTAILGASGKPVLLSDLTRLRKDLLPQLPVRTRQRTRPYPPNVRKNSHQRERSD